MEYYLTMKCFKKYEILKQAAAKQLKGKETALFLGYHPVHISRLKKVMASGIQGILRPKLLSIGSFFAFLFSYHSASQ